MSCCPRGTSDEEEPAVEPKSGDIIEKHCCLGDQTCEKKKRASVERPQKNDRPGFWQRLVFSHRQMATPPRADDLHDSEPEPVQMQTK